ncbi:hypothetical protein BU17DRAFT_61007 [Hysterangium stoloniferum]|nr:hypothetical protein BU17DRAFT_61007 [Hysterangium stoloniferum]
MCFLGLILLLLMVMVWWWAALVLASEEDIVLKRAKEDDDDAGTEESSGAVSVAFWDRGRLMERKMQVKKLTTTLWQSRPQQEREQGDSCRQLDRECRGSPHRNEELKVHILCSPGCTTAWLGGVDGGVNWDSLSWWCGGMEMDGRYEYRDRRECRKRGGERERDMGCGRASGAGASAAASSITTWCLSWSGDGRYGGTVTGENAGRGRERERERDGREMGDASTVTGGRERWGGAGGVSGFVTVSTTASSIMTWCLSWSGDERYGGTVTGENSQVTLTTRGHQRPPECRWADHHLITRRKQLSPKIELWSDKIVNSCRPTRASNSENLGDPVVGSIRLGACTEASRFPCWIGFVDVHTARRWWNRECHVLNRTKPDQRSRVTWNEDGWMCEDMLSQSGASKWSRLWGWFEPLQPFGSVPPGCVNLR